MKLNKITAILVTSSCMIYVNSTVAAAGGGGGSKLEEVTPSCSSSPDGKTVTISWDKDSKHYAYTIALSHIGNSWEYTVSNGPGNEKNLSHWDLGIPNCESHVTSASPTPDHWGPDPAGGNFDGVKWNTEGGVPNAGTTFTLTLDGAYAEKKTVDVLAKSATYYGKCTIVGPDCSSMAPDDDLDYIANIDDNCPSVYNPDQADRDGDGIGTACDPVEESDDVNLKSFDAKATGYGTKVEWETGYEENITAFNLYRGILKVGTECTANEDDYDDITLVGTINSGDSPYKVKDKFTADANTTYCYGLVSINNNGDIVDVLDPVKRQ